MEKTYRESKSWILQAIRGRYQLPSRKSAIDTMLSMRAKSDNELAIDLKALLAERISPSISGDVASIPLVAYDLSACVACQAATGSTDSC